jgi:hypothetical protein
MITLILVSLLLTGCLGRTSTKYVYDGSPTALEVVIKRDAVGPMSLSATEQSKQFVRVKLWMDNDAGETIYQSSETIPLSEITADGYKLAREVPANKGYSVVAVYSDNRGYFEVAQQLQINAPAEKVTTASVNMVPVEYEIVIPDKMYSGGTMNQFKIVFPEEYVHLFSHAIRFSYAPWEVNGDPYRTEYSSPRLPKNAPKVEQPEKYYYQLVIDMNREYVTNVPALRAYMPNLDYEKDLPVFWVYPYPGYQE